MEQNLLAKSLPRGNSMIQEVVGYVEFHDLALTLNASEMGSNDLVLDSIWPATHQKAMTTPKATMALGHTLMRCATWQEICCPN